MPVINPLTIFIVLPFIFTSVVMVRFPAMLGLIVILLPTVLILSCPFC